MRGFDRGNVGLDGCGAGREWPMRDAGDPPSARRPGPSYACGGDDVAPRSLVDQLLHHAGDWNGFESPAAAPAPLPRLQEPAASARLFHSPGPRRTTGGDAAASYSWSSPCTSGVIALDREPRSFEGAWPPLQMESTSAPPPQFTNYSNGAVSLPWSSPRTTNGVAALDRVPRLFDGKWQPADLGLPPPMPPLQTESTCTPRTQCTTYSNGTVSHPWSSPRNTNGVIVLDREPQSFNAGLQPADLGLPLPMQPLQPVSFGQAYSATVAAAALEDQVCSLQSSLRQSEDEQAALQGATTAWKERASALQDAEETARLLQNTEQRLSSVLAEAVSHLHTDLQQSKRLIATAAGDPDSDSAANLSCKLEAQSADEVLKSLAALVECSRGFKLEVREVSQTAGSNAAKADEAELSAAEWRQIALGLEATSSQQLDELKGYMQFAFSLEATSSQQLDELAEYIGHSQDQATGFLEESLAFRELHHSESMVSRRQHKLRGEHGRVREELLDSQQEVTALRSSHREERQKRLELTAEIEGMREDLCQESARSHRLAEDVRRARFEKEDIQREQLDLTTKVEEQRRISQQDVRRLRTDLDRSLAECHRQESELHSCASEMLNAQEEATRYSHEVLRLQDSIAHERLLSDTHRRDLHRVPVLQEQSHKLRTSLEQAEERLERLASELQDESSSARRRGEEFDRTQAHRAELESILAQQTQETEQLESKLAQQTQEAEHQQEYAKIQSQRAEAAELASSVAQQTQERLQAQADETDGFHIELKAKLKAELRSEQEECRSMAAAWRNAEERAERLQEEMQERLRARSTTEPDSPRFEVMPESPARTPPASPTSGRRRASRPQVVSRGKSFVDLTDERESHRPSGEAHVRAAAASARMGRGSVVTRAFSLVSPSIERRNNTHRADLPDASPRRNLRKGVAHDRQGRAISHEEIVAPLTPRSSRASSPRPLPSQKRGSNQSVDLGLQSDDSSS